MAVPEKKREAERVTASIKAAYHIGYLPMKTETKVVLFAGQLAMGYLGWTSDRRVFSCSALLGIVARNYWGGVEDGDAKVSDHLKINALSRTINPEALQVALGLFWFISHADHHALHHVPLKPIVFGYVFGSYTTHVWKTKSF
jgi:hypothetical protein